MYQISSEWLTLEALEAIVQEKKEVALSPQSKSSIQDCFDFLHQKLAQSEAPYYGINTGFGSLCDIKIDSKELEALQTNLVTSHACGMGEEVPTEVLRLMLFLKVKSLSLGHSAVSLPLVERLLSLYNTEVWPVVYQQGSLGASGDLAPLAHLGLPLLGKGWVNYQGKRQASAVVLQQLGWEPLRLKAKEGIAILNGTQFSTAYGVWAVLKAKRLSNWADLIAALSIDAFGCLSSPFDDRIHQVRAHDGQVATAANIRRLLEGSAIAAKPKETVQDPYAFRCVPQVHGASKDSIAHTAKVLEREINSVTDNPNIFPETDAILSGGNFHAQPVALVLDFLAIALSELGSISERRLYQLIGGKRGLPPFLTAHSGLHSGLMISQYTAASIASQNKQLCTPASVDSIVSCNGQEDHVSMAANAGTKLYKVVKNVERLLAIELVAAAQALSFIPEKTSPLLEGLVHEFRKVVPVLEEDRELGEDLQAAERFVQTFDLSTFFE
ncbi:MAG: histidine ammonia-lyase [Aureispira sp.]